MGAQVVDYRVSTLVVLCKDCGHDVGLYPSRHKCQTNVSLPPVPSIPTRFAESNESLQVPRKSVHSPETSSSNGSYSRPTSAASSSSFSSASTPNFSDSTTASSPASGKWSRFGQRNKQSEDQQQLQQPDDESIYFNNFAAHLPEEERQGRKLWGKVRQNEKWKQMNEKNDVQKPSGKLWGKLLSATQNISDKIPSREDKGPDSDESDWEGESHVSRALREYYETKRRPLPNWLRDERTPSATKYREPVQDQQHNNHRGRVNYEPSSHQDDTTKTSSRRRLWDHSQEPSNRERERQELRQQPPPEDNISNSQRQRQYRTQHRDEYDHYDTTSASPSHTATRQSLRSRNGYTDQGRGYDNSDAFADNDHRSYRDHQQPTSYRTNARISQGDTRMDQSRRHRMHDDDYRSGYENDMEDHYQSSRQRHQDRMRAPRDPPSRPNRYLDTNADYF
ncbi:hypothetical protein BCR42DRAFT_423735 [Absidia repens]|uniref:Mso1 N-terminal domain-containing protein n=1 Tax=Absidia repens TaxID=90262 RepID=A0A1X2I567_9FUNG|nr:hypothetical protein BCR42DRAFT_423735 [Absidia repens]